MIVIICQKIVFFMLVVVYSSQDDRSAQMRERDEKVQRLTVKLRELEQNHANAKAHMNQTAQTLSSLTESRNEHAYVHCILRDGYTKNVASIAYTQI